MRRFSSIRDAIIISGSDMNATTHAYTEMSMPACASLMRRSEAISDNSPMGMNSDVLKTKAEHASPTSGNHWPVEFPFTFVVIAFLLP